MARAEEKTSASRREEILEAAVEVFADYGYYRATTAQVAKRAGISQPYVYRFFQSKESLLLAALDRSWERILRSFRQVQSSPQMLEEELIRAYEQLIDTHEKEILLQVQAQAIRDEAIQEAMRNGFRSVLELVFQLYHEAGIEHPGEKTMIFLARGMLCNISLAIGMPDLQPKSVSRMQADRS